MNWDFHSIWNLIIRILEMPCGKTNARIIFTSINTWSIPPTIDKELRFLVFQSLIYIKALIFPVLHMSIPHWSQRCWRNTSPFHKHNHCGAPRKGLLLILTKVYQHNFAIVIHATAIDRFLSFCHISPPPHLDQGRRYLQLLLLVWSR